MTDKTEKTPTPQPEEETTKKPEVGKEPSGGTPGGEIPDSEETEKLEEPEETAQGEKEDTSESEGEKEDTPKPGAFKAAIDEIVEPFKGLAHTSRSLYGIYVSYVLEGLVYFGILTIFGKYLSENVGLSDMHAGWVYSIFTGGITLAMLFLGGVADKIGVRKALLFSLGLMIFGRLAFAASGTFFPHGGGFGSMMFLFIGVGILLVVIGYGMYQPAAYSGVKQFTDSKNAPMAFAMIYGLMNLGAFFSGLLSPAIRNNLGITSVFWVYTGASILAFLVVLMVMTSRAVQKDTVTEINKKKKEEGDEPDTPQARLFTPAFGISAVAVVVALVSTILLVFTAKPGPIDSPMTEYGRKMIQAGRLLQPASGENAPPPATVQDFEKLGAEITALSYTIRPPEVLPEGAAVDGPTYAMLGRIIREQGDFVASSADLMGSLPHRIPAPGESATQLYVQTRALGVAYMSAAYRLVGNFNADVLRRISQQQSLPTEKAIPLPEHLRTELMRITTLPVPGMFTELAVQTRAVGTASSTLFGEGGAALDQLLQLEGRVLEEIGLVAGTDMSPSLKNLLVERLYNSGVFLIKQVSPLLVNETSEKSVDFNASVLAMHFSNQAGFTGTMKESAQSAILVPGGTSLKQFGKRFGLPLGMVILFTAILIGMLLKKRPDHPFHDGRFVFFIFILIPVQTLFAHNWLTLPYFIDRAFGGTPVGANFEFFANINPILIFFLTPFVAALTAKSDVYRMITWGTLVMAAPTFLLTLPPTPALLLLYILLMTIGEAMWQPRFLQWVAQIAPEGKTGSYMGIAQFPWFLTKVLTGFYSGYFLAKYCPLVGPQNTEMLWLIYGIIAMVSPVALILAKGWVAKGMGRRA